MAAPRSRIFRNTAVFSVLTGLSRIAGLAREIVAAGYYGTSGPAAAFTIAFQVPNLVRALVADAALSSAFVPVFTDLLQRGRKREAVQLAASLLGLILVVLSTITVVFMLAAGTIMPLFAGDKLSARDVELMVGLSQVLFPIVVLLGVNGLVVGILSAYDHFSIPALAPLVWNLVIIACLVGLHGRLEGDTKIYAYAIGILVGTAVQLLMVLPVLQRVGFPLRVSLRFRRTPLLKRVLILMLPVTISLGVINVSLLINSSLGTLVSEGAARAIDAAFRIYMLPQGMFSVAVATVLFPALARLASARDYDGLRRFSGSGTRMIFLALVPCAAATVALAEPITRLVYERGEFGPESTRQTAQALLWFSFSLPFAGVNLLLTRSLFALQRPWIPTRLAAVSLLVNVVVSVALVKPLGIAGIVVGTAVSSLVMMVQLMLALRGLLGGFELARTLRAFAVMSAAAALSGLIAYGIWRLLDAALGDSLLGQVGSVGGGLAAGLGIYMLAITVARVPEAQELAAMARRRA